MIAISKNDCTSFHDGTIQGQFASLLPQIERHLRYAFRHLTGDAFDESMAEGMANCFVAFVRLCQRGQQAKGFASSLARFAARQVKSGRTVGGHLKVTDPLSPHAQQRKQIRVERLDRYGSGAGEWLEPLVADRRASIPDQVAMRIDVPAWFASLTQQKQKIACDLALGSSTAEVARKHKISSGRISQVRRELYESWNAFHERTDQATEAT